MRPDEGAQEPERSPWRDVLAVVLMVLGASLLTTGVWIALGIGWGLAILGATVLTVGLLLGRA